MSLRKIIQTMIEFVFVELYAIVIGAGFGFVLGLCAFSKESTGTMLQAAMWSASLGMEVVAFLFPILYFALMRNSLSLRDFLEMNALILIVGLLSAYFIGWVSSVITIFAAVYITFLYCMANFRIIRNTFDQ